VAVGNIPKKKGFLDQRARAQQARHLNEMRRLDRMTYRGIAPQDRPDYYTGSGLREYRAIFNTNLAAVAGKLAQAKAAEIEIARRTRQKVIQPQVHALEISAGQGMFLKQLKAGMKRNVKTFATGLSRPPNTAGIDRYFVGKIAPPKSGFWRSQEKFDLIISHAGETQELTGEQLLPILSRLTRRGIAFLDLGNWPRAIANEIMDTIEQHGFKITIVNEWAGAGAMSSGKAIAIKVVRYGRPQFQKP